jgi:hypothetical protein
MVTATTSATTKTAATTPSPATDSALPAPTLTVHPADRMKMHWAPGHVAETKPLVRNNDPDTSTQPTSSNSIIPPIPSDDDDDDDNDGPAAPPTDFCRHWCHFGTCKWDLRCRYAHNMPTTKRGLAAVGLANFPPWWVLATSTFASTAPSRSPSAAAAAALLGGGTVGGGGGSSKALRDLVLLDLLGATDVGGVFRPRGSGRGMGRRMKREVTPM